MAPCPFRHDRLPQLHTLSQVNVRQAARRPRSASPGFGALPTETKRQPAPGRAGERWSLQGSGQDYLLTVAATRGISTFLGRCSNPYSSRANLAVSMDVEAKSVGIEPSPEALRLECRPAWAFRHNELRAVLSVVEAAVVAQVDIQVVQPDPHSS